MKKQEYDTWDYLEDTPEEFDMAIKNAASDKEREFFEKLRYKILHETAFSNDVLMHEKDILLPDFASHEMVYLKETVSSDGQQLKPNPR